MESVGLRVTEKFSLREITRKGNQTTIEHCQGSIQFRDDRQEQALYSHLGHF
jgi:hypothetical protein